MGIGSRFGNLGNEVGRSGRVGRGKSGRSHNGIINGNLDENNGKASGGL